MTGPTVTFSSTLRCGKRLCAWKTIALCARRRPARASRVPARSPRSTSPIPTTPASGRSRALRERSTVVLPEPDGPIRTVTVPGIDLEVDSAQDRQLPERLLHSLDLDQRPASLGVVMSESFGHEPLESGLQPLLPERQDQADHPVVEGRDPYSAKNWKVGAAATCATRSNSVTSTTDASEVSLTSEIKVLDSGGTAVRAAWGKMMRRSVVRSPYRPSRLPPTGLAAPRGWPIG